MQRLSAQEKEYILTNYQYNPKTGKIWSKLVKREVGYLSDDGYIILYIRDKLYLAHHIAFLFMTDDFPDLSNKKVVDHKNNIRSDNCWKNLRLVSQKENIRNSSQRKTKSGFRGVCYIKSHGKHDRWVAECRIDNIRYILGSYKDVVAAAEIYDDFIIYKIPTINKNNLNFPNRKNKPVSNKLQNLTGKPYIKTTIPPLEKLLFYLKNNFQYCPKTGLITRISTGKIIKEKSYNNDHKSFLVNFDNYSQRIMYHRVAWFLYYGQWDLKGQVIDHINNIRTDNCIKNLRLVSIQVNNLNKNIQKNNTSGYRGVAFDKSRNKWLLVFKFFGYQINGGRFNKIEDAAKMYDDIMFYLHKEYAKLNFPKRKPKLPPQRIINKTNQILQKRNQTNK